MWWGVSGLSPVLFFICLKYIPSSFYWNVKRSISFKILFHSRNRYYLTIRIKTRYSQIKNDCFIPFLKEYRFHCKATTFAPAAEMCVFYFFIFFIVVARVVFCYLGYQATICCVIVRKETILIKNKTSRFVKWVFFYLILSLVHIDVLSSLGIIGCELLAML